MQAGIIEEHEQGTWLLLSMMCNLAGGGGGSCRAETLQPSADILIKSHYLSYVYCSYSRS
jgi:hypothetical protein